MGVTPAGAWQALTKVHAHRALPADGAKQLHFLVSFLPMERRTIQGNGLTLFYLRYWHPIFVAWREMGGQVIVRYHPEDLSRVFVSRNGKDYLEARIVSVRAAMGGAHPYFLNVHWFDSIEQARQQSSDDDSRAGHPAVSP